MVNEYIEFLKLSNKNYSECTIKTYKNNVLKFLKWINKQYDEKENNAVTYLDIREYQSYLLNVKKYAPAGVQQRIVSVLSYCRFLHKNNWLKTDITSSFQHIKIQSQDTAPETPSTIEVNKFRREVYKKNNIRDIAIVELLLNTLMIQKIFKEGKWNDIFTEDDFRGLTPLIYGHINPYGNFKLNMTKRIEI